ncbi:MAG: folate-binding protein YgfZ [Pseudomonadales bacterium]|nr:folate-binding protein YgfZ [Pseudomonadales bacterium]
MSASWPEFVQMLNLPTAAEALADNAIYPLPALSFLQIEGPDAAKFLQGQLSCDVNAVSPEHSSIGSHCTPKGRMLSSFRILQVHAERFLLAMDHSIIEEAKKALAKYIVFSKAEIQKNDWVAIGLHGEQAKNNLQNIFSSIPEGDYQQLIKDDAIIICTSQKQQSYEIYLSPEQAIILWPRLSQGIAIHNAQQQTLIQHDLGLVFIEQASFDAFIPQMFNYQATPAVNFKKGCYTGQEIVARMQYLGKLKRHMYHYLLECNQPLNTGDSVYIADKKQAIGDIVSAVKTAEKRWDVLMILTHEGAGAETLHCNENELTNLQKQALPYDVEGLV